MVLILAVTIIAAFLVEYRKIRTVALPDTGKVERSDKNYQWDVFLAAPMAALPSNDFEYEMKRIKEIKAILEVKFNFRRVFFAGSNMKTVKDFETEDLSIDMDLEALKKSRMFILIYPEKVVSSVLLEAGIALALGKPSFYFGRTENFPFLMKQANQQYRHVKKFESSSMDDIVQILTNNPVELFNVC
jgi:hypothetical protein